MRFTPEIRMIGLDRATYPIEDLVEETSVYAASPEFVEQHCGPIANRILNAVPDEYFERCLELGLLPNIDFRVHRLNVGEYPAIPGWHCDGVYRETYHGQPDMGRIRIRDTVLCGVSTEKGGVSNPEILVEPIDVEDPPEPDADSRLWRWVDARVPNDAPRLTLRDGEMVQIGAETLHRVMPATRRGVRALFRMSMWHNPYLGEHGKIAKQQQVYLVEGGGGW